MYSLVTQELDLEFTTNHYYRIFAYQKGCPDQKNMPGSGHPSSDGCYAWAKVHIYPDPSQVDTGTQLYADTAQTTLSNFYVNASNLVDFAPNGLAPLVMGAAFKGFDDYQAMWWPTSGDKILTQGCGTTWQSTFAEPGLHGFGTNNPLPYMMVETWDDYEEGTEAETGISNCVNPSSFILSLANTTLSWQFNFSSQQNIQFNPKKTVHNYILYSSTDNGQLPHYAVKDTQIHSNSCAYDQSKAQMSCAIDLNTYQWTHGVTYKLVVQAVGQASIINNMSSNTVNFVGP